MGEWPGAAPPSSFRRPGTPGRWSRLAFSFWRGLKLAEAALKPIYRAANASAAAAMSTEFDESKWGRKYAAIEQSWRRSWGAASPSIAVATDAHKVIYTTNAIASLNAPCARPSATKDVFPVDQAAKKRIWLALRNITENRKGPLIVCHAAKAQLAIRFEDRFVLN